VTLRLRGRGRLRVLAAATLALPGFGAAFVSVVTRVTGEIAHVADGALGVFAIGGRGVRRSRVEAHRAFHANVEWLEADLAAPRFGTLTIEIAFDADVAIVVARLAVVAGFGPEVAARLFACARGPVANGTIGGAVARAGRSGAVRALCVCAAFDAAVMLDVAVTPRAAVALVLTDLAVGRPVTARAAGAPTRTTGSTAGWTVVAPAVGRPVPHVRHAARGRTPAQAGTSAARALAPRRTGLTGGGGRRSLGQKLHGHVVAADSAEERQGKATTEIAEHLPKPSSRIVPGAAEGRRAADLFPWNIPPSDGRGACPARGLVPLSRSATIVEGRWRSVEGHSRWRRTRRPDAH